MRRVDFFPLPHVLADECEVIRKATWMPAPTLHVWQCEVCGTRQASERAERCHKCSTSHLDMRKLTSEVITDVEMKRHHERVRTNPEEFVRVADLFREAYANVERRKREAA